MSAYSGLAGSYDRLTGDVDYGAYYAFCKKIFDSAGTEISSVLDLGCGTGTFTLMFAGDGYDMIGVDAAPEMLNEAADKAAEEGLASRILFINQQMEELDLYGTVDAAVSTLDCVNYIEPECIEEVFRRLALFVRPGGVLIFDMLTPNRLKSLDGQIFCDDREDLLCIWQAGFDKAQNSLNYELQCFNKSDNGLYSRTYEEHTEYAHSPANIRKLLLENKFNNIKVYRDFEMRPGRTLVDDRLYFVCRRK